MVNLLKSRKVPAFFNNPSSIIANEYEKIRINLEFSSFETKSRVLIITSPGFGEGKSTTVANLAVSLAQEGKNVLLIDTDVKDPTIHKMFKMKNAIGLTNFLSGQKKMEEIVNRTEIARLKLITSGPVPHDSEKIFKSRLMETLITEGLKQYDYVLFDSPPVLEGDEAKVVASRCEGVILVIRNGKTEDTLALEAKKSLETSNAKLLGVILNGKPRGFFKKNK
ncbi:CpsD/CapB family tyrosine-protein kinase [Alteribacter populi]|uniref:CpsD/CapB family tyrosine-protein kinase n=1 Tax=Alteribacter populi TaxID=2011011 RepID=UPI0012FE04CA|nr:CpsD/CapB family tyrosine-protein kinase [Alteribacter populi]